MATYKIIFKRKDCIGAAECAAISPKLWKMQNDSKATLSGASVNPHTGEYELEIDASKLEEQEAVVSSCPAGCIRIEKLRG